MIDANRGGVVVDVGMRGFVPLSQLGSVARSTRRRLVCRRPWVSPRERSCASVSSRSTRSATAHPLSRRPRPSSSAGAQSAGRRDAQGGRCPRRHRRERHLVRRVRHVGVAEGSSTARSDVAVQKGDGRDLHVHRGSTGRVVVVAIAHERQRISLSISGSRKIRGDLFVRTARGGARRWAATVVGDAVAGRSPASPRALRAVVPRERVAPDRWRTRAPVACVGRHAAGEDRLH